MNKMTIALIGNPNCGKTTLFNHLTGAKQRIGNWPGVTVERKEGTFNWASQQVDVVDLPGIYSLVSVNAETIDEKITYDYLLTHQAHLIVQVIDAANLERHLYLSMQLLELGVPLLIVLNMMDVVKKRGAHIDIKKLSAGLGCRVIALENHQKNEIERLKQQICYEPKCSTHSIITYPKMIEKALSACSDLLTKQQLAIPFAQNTRWWSLKLLEEDEETWLPEFAELTTKVKELKKQIQTNSSEEADILIADTRFSFINQLTQDSYFQSKSSRVTLSKKLDKFLLHRFLALPLFFLTMYSMFLFAINIGGALQGFFDLASDTIFVQGLSYLLMKWHSPTWLTAILASGLGKGINTTITFIPILGAMFLFLSFLEDSGYMVRAAFVMDKVMRSLGLPGKSFVPLIVGFGCNVPAVMSARILDTQRDRILTVLMTPFMSCGARLAIFAVFISAFFPTGGQNIVFALYLLGILAAIFTGLILRKLFLIGETAPLVMELPAYHLPTLKTLLLHTWNKLKSFLWRAGKFIVPICMLIGVLNTLTWNSNSSLLALVGQYLTPLFAPLGLQQNNWPATVGLLTGILAKEVMVGTLNTLYAEVGNLIVYAPEQFNFWSGMQNAFATIPANLAALSHAFANPILANAKLQSVSDGVFGQMYQRFDGKIGAFAYLLFILLYVPCVSTLAVILRELGKKWMWFSLIWNTSLAYGIAAIFYQLATFVRHPSSSLSWIMGILVFNTLLILFLRLSLKDSTSRTTASSKMASL